MDPPGISVSDGAITLPYSSPNEGEAGNVKSEVPFSTSPPRPIKTRKVRDPLSSHNPEGSYWTMVSPTKRRGIDPGEGSLTRSSSDPHLTSSNILNPISTTLNISIISPPKTKLKLASRSPLSAPTPRPTLISPTVIDSSLAPASPTTTTPPPLDGDYWAKFDENSVRQRPRAIFEPEGWTVRYSQKTKKVDEDTLERYRQNNLVRQLQLKQEREDEYLARQARYEASRRGTEIYPGVFLGSRTVAANEEFLMESNITAILNAAREVQKTQHPFILRYHHLSICDSLDEDLTHLFSSTVNFISETHPNSILIHCAQGKSRSPTFLLAYGILHRKETLKIAYDNLISKCPFVSINPNFMHQLMNLDKATHGRLSLDIFDSALRTSI
eukprot:TRINITY_DN2764_c0_g1_i3.p1 TRINITY_DN2764_c0_g1~~TRINITY_DN2764_c0_g1_i3.p1  ORF type:complete len:385 (+),score=26.93 TRINITY_DN2764_c0_g1_i3:49-1203(+)